MSLILPPDAVADGDLVIRADSSHGEVSDAAGRVALILPPSLAAERERAREEVIQSERAETRAALFAGFSERGPDPDPRWQEELNRITPRDGVNSWLLLRWNPGYPWAPVNRWTVYQMLERPAIPDIAIPYLEGPDPRTRGHWNTRKGEWVTDCFVTRQQWLMYRETGCYGMTYWIIQGEHGGHRAKFTEVEAQVSALNGGPRTPPVPGALPFAPFDNRVVAKLEKALEASVWSQLIGYAERRPQDFEAAEQRLVEESRGLLWDWLRDQVVEAADGATTAAVQDAFQRADLPRTSGAPLEELEAQARAEFVHDHDN